MYIKALLPTAATRLFDSCYKFFEEKAARQDGDMKTKLSVKCTGTEENRLNNVIRELKTAFKMPRNGHNYIRVPINALNEVIYD